MAIDKRMLIVIGTIFVVVMLLFGKNPLEIRVMQPTEAFQAAMENKLNEQNNNYTNLSSYMNANAGYSTGSGGAAGYASGGPYTTPGAMRGGVLRGPGMTGIPVNNMPQNANYGFPTSSKAKSEEPEGRKVPAFFLTDGRRIFFSGYKVFVLAMDGSLQPLPDGAYKLQTGDTILIKDGIRTTQK